MRIILGAMGYMLMWGLVLGTVLGALFGCGLISLSAPGAFYAGLMYGGLYGLAGGVLSGTVSGLALGVVTYLFFNPPIDREQYRSIIAALCYVCGIVVAGIGFGIVFDFEGVFTFIPALIAGIAAGYTGYRYTTYYFPSDKAKRKNDEKPKRDEL